MAAEARRLRERDAAIDQYVQLIGTPSDRAAGYTKGVVAAGYAAILAVLDWLRKTGYPLELRVGRRFQAAGWETTYSR